MFQHATTAALALLVSVSSASAEGAACPARQKDPLVSIELLDGPVSDNVVLAPDQSSGNGTKGKSVWRVNSVYDEGRLLTIACSYKSSTKPLMIEVKAKVSTCTHMIDQKAGDSFTCK